MWKTAVQENNYHTIKISNIFETRENAMGIEGWGEGVVLKEGITKKIKGLLVPYSR